MLTAELGRRSICLLTSTEQPGVIQASMKLTFLGTGTSHGVPMIGCGCPVCNSNNPKNNRTRSSAVIEAAGINILIDTTPELRIQTLREKISVVNAVLFTHSHADHLFGLDDIRRFNEISGLSMPCYADANTFETMRRAFDYIFKGTNYVGGSIPSIIPFEIDGPFDVFGVCVTPIPIFHGRLKILGYRIGDLAYITDCSKIPDKSIDLLQNLDTLVLGVIRHEPHPTHFTVNQGIEIVEQLRPRRTFFTHIAHQLEHEATNRNLPPNVSLAYDGLQLSI